MNLPTLPPVLFVINYMDDSYTAEQMQAYGQQCREAALDESATRCERVIDTEKVCGIEASRLLKTADLIRSLKS